MGIIKKIQEMKQEMTRWRQKLHQDPELAFNEKRTMRFITRQLEDFGLEVEGIAKTGVVGILHGRNGPGGKAIMLRADMDALPIQEKTGVTHASRNDGVMHACGHDGHMAMLLGAAKHLAQTKDFDGTIYFVFQPAEEDVGGALEMIKQGLFTKYKVDEVYGMHNYPGLPLGTMATGPGAMLAASEDFTLTVRGKGGHTSRAENTTDVLGAAAEIALAFKQLAKDVIPADQTATLTVSSFSTQGEAANVLPDTAKMNGTLRTFDEGLHQQLIDGMIDIVDAAEKKHGVLIDFDTKAGYPVLVNDKAATAFALDVARDTVGDAQVITPVPPTLGTEDFAYYLQQKPGNYIALGTGKPGAQEYTDIHSAKYDFNDAALPIGASYWVNLVEKALPVLNPPVPGADGTQPPAPSSPAAPAAPKP